MNLPVPLNSFLAPSGDGASCIWGERGGVARSRRKLGLPARVRIGVRVGVGGRVGVRVGLRV